MQIFASGMRKKSSEGNIGFIIRGMSTAPNETTSNGRPTSVPQKEDRYFFGALESFGKNQVLRGVDLHVGRGELAAQVQEVLGLQQPGVGQGVQVGHAVVERLGAVLVEAEVAQAQRIQHRRHPGRGALRVVRQHG